MPKYSVWKKYLSFRKRLIYFLCINNNFILDVPGHNRMIFYLHLLPLWVMSLVPGTINGKAFFSGFSNVFLKIKQIATT